MSNIARTGNLAETILCKQTAVHNALGVSAIVHVPGRKKTDAIGDNGDKYQLKNVDRTSKSYRGHSVDRKPWGGFVKVVRSNRMRAALFEVTQKKKRGLLHKLFPTPIGSIEESQAIVERAVMGEEDEFKPTQFISTRLNAKKTEIVAIAICPAAKLLEHLFSTLYEHPLVKRTCIYLAPNIYLQRKGADKTDTKANDIQTKIIFDESIHALFTELSLESTRECPV